MTTNEVIALRDGFFGKYRNLVDWNRQVHESIFRESGDEKGHGVDHDLTVMMYCLLIAENDRVGEKAACAALTHSWDRHLQQQEVDQLYDEYKGLICAKFSPSEIEEIMIAVRLHSKLNDESDGPVIVTLKDADRLANTGYLNLARGAQHHCGVPVAILATLDKMHPGSTFKKPACWLDALRYNLEWEAMLRLPKAKELGHPKFRFIENFLQGVQDEFRSVGLFPVPSELA